MSEYRVYFVGPDDHFQGVETIDCASDDEAVTLALEGRGKFPAVEVWCGTRPVGKLSPSDD